MPDIPKFTKEELLEYGAVVALAPESDLELLQDGCQIYTVLTEQAGDLPSLFMKRNRFIRLALADPRKVSGPGETWLGPMEDGSVFCLISYTIATEELINAQNQTMEWSGLMEAEFKMAMARKHTSGLATPPGFGGFGGARG